MAYLPMRLGGFYELTHGLNGKGEVKGKNSYMGKTKGKDSYKGNIKSKDSDKGKDMSLASGCCPLGLILDGTSKRNCEDSCRGGYH